MAHIREIVGKFLVRTGMAPTVLGQAAVGDGGAIASILGGRRSPTIDTVEKLVRFMDGYGKRGSRRPPLLCLLGKTVNRALSSSRSPASPRS